MVGTDIIHERSEPILSQDEIDSLLGIRRGEKDAVGHIGVRALIDPATVETVFGRVVRLMTTSLRSFTSDDVEVSLDRIDAIRCGDHLNSIARPAIVASFRAGKFGNSGLLAVDSNLIESAAKALMGGRRGGAPTFVQDRPCTAIERMVATRMIEVVLGDVRQAFAPLTGLEFKIERVAADPDFAAIASPPHAAIAVTLRVDMVNGGGRLELLLPYALLEPICEDAGA